MSLSLYIYIYICICVYVDIYAFICRHTCMHVSQMSPGAGQVFRGLGHAHRLRADCGANADRNRADPQGSEPGSAGVQGLGVRVQG